MSPLRDDATRVREALAALAAHDSETARLVKAPVGRLTAMEWTERAVLRRKLGAALEERAGILARLVLAVHK